MEDALIQFSPSVSTNSLPNAGLLADQGPGTGPCQAVSTTHQKAGQDSGPGPGSGPKSCQRPGHGPALGPNLGPGTAASGTSLKTIHPRLALTKSLCINSSLLSMNSSVSTAEIVDEKPIIPSIHIRASTIERLIERCVEHFDPVSGDLLSGSEFVHVLFTMHKWVISSHEFANRFLRLYDEAMRVSYRVIKPTQVPKRKTAAVMGSSDYIKSLPNYSAGLQIGVTDESEPAGKSSVVHDSTRQNTATLDPSPWQPLASDSNRATGHQVIVSDADDVTSRGSESTDSKWSELRRSEPDLQQPEVGKVSLGDNAGVGKDDSERKLSIPVPDVRTCGKFCSSVSISPEPASCVSHTENDVHVVPTITCSAFAECQQGSTYNYVHPIDDTTRNRVHQICFALKYWITKLPVHFDTDDALARCMADFCERLKSDGFGDMSSMLDTSDVPNFDWMRNISVRCPARNQPNGRNVLITRKTSRGSACPTSSTENNKVALVFNKLQPEVIADQLTVLEYKAFRRIPFSDFKQYATTSSLDKCQRLERSIVLFNGLTQWVECMILCRTTPQERAAVISKFILVAKRLNQLQNFNSLMAVVGGICHSAISRLGRTFAFLDSEMHKTLTSFSEFLSSSSNYSAYRRHLAQCRDFRIPILGVHLKDLICTHIAMNDHVTVEQSDSNLSSSCSNINIAWASTDGIQSGQSVNLINVRKLVQLSMIFDELMQIQASSTPVEENTDLCNMLKLSLDMNYSEEEIYELSLAREPRNSLTSMSASVKPVPFAEFVAGIRPPDPETVNKHVRDMVDAVFKVYDHDKDGFISQEEFEEITQNFPFIDAFCVLDTDNDGVISRSEMLAYFIKGNSRLLRSSFKHNFHETTYFRPTFCAHCNGLLWGIIKQGWKCRDCGINSHRHCKDQIVCECRQRSTSLGSNANPGLGNEKEHKRVHVRATSSASIGIENGATNQLSASTSTINTNGYGNSHSKSNGHAINERLELIGRPPIVTNGGNRKQQLEAPTQRANNKSSVRRRHTIHTCQETQTDDVILEETLHEMNEQFETDDATSEPRCASASASVSASPASNQTSSISIINSCTNSSTLLFAHNSIARTSSTSSIGTAAKHTSSGGTSEVARSASACSPTSQTRKVSVTVRQKPPRIADDRPATRMQRSRVKFAQVTNSMSSVESYGSTNSIASVASGNGFIMASYGSSSTTNNAGTATPNLSSVNGFNLVSFASVATQFPSHCASVATETTAEEQQVHEMQLCDSVYTHDLAMAMAIATPRDRDATAELDSPFYESAAEQYNRLLKAEAENEQLEMENAQLRLLLLNTQQQLQSMRSQISNVRHHTIEFILHQMDVLHVQRDSEV